MNGVDAVQLMMASYSLQMLRQVSQTRSAGAELGGRLSPRSMGTVGDEVICTWGYAERQKWVETSSIISPRNYRILLGCASNSWPARRGGSSHGDAVRAVSVELRASLYGKAALEQLVERGARGAHRSRPRAHGVLHLAGCRPSPAPWSQPEATRRRGGRRAILQRNTSAAQRPGAYAAAVGQPVVV